MHQDKEYHIDPLLLRQGVGDVENRTLSAGRALRERKIAKPCPTCKADIAEFLSTAQVNRQAARQYR